MEDLESLPLPALFRRLSAGGSVRRVLAAAREEDLGAAGDVTSESLIDPRRAGRGAVSARAAGVVAGLAAVPLLLEVFEAPLRFEPGADDGARCAAGAVLATLTGPLAATLGVERTLLNLLGHLGGIASLTRRCVQAVEGTRATICATRKTAPGLRGLEKYAVRCGGGAIHRLGLYDAALYKDNHLAAVAAGDLPGVLGPAIGAVRGRHAVRFVAVEVEGPDQLEAVLGLAPGLVDIVLLDNFSPGQVREAVARRDARAPGVQLEASGGVTEGTVRAYAEAGADRISIGALTHSAPALDVALDVAPEIEPEGNR